LKHGVLVLVFGLVDPSLDYITGFFNNRCLEPSKRSSIS